MPERTIPRLDSKLPGVGTTIFTVMSRLALEHGAINLSQGFPDFDCDPALVEAVARHMREGRNQYAPMQGVPALCEAIAAKFAALHGRRYDPESEITVTSGGTEALFDAVAAIVRPGDEVIVFEPCYDSYVPAIQINGGVPVVITLSFPDYAIDWDDVRRAITPRTRMLILNSPHNPSGSILAEEDLRQLEALVDGTDLLVLSDEVYEHIIFDGRRHESMARREALAARTFIVGSFGKMYHTTGWKLGYCAAPAPLSVEFRKVHQFVTFSSITPVQHAFAEFLARNDGYPALAGFYQAKRDLFLRLMEGSRFRPLACRGSYFQLMDYSAITDGRDAEFAIRLLKEHGVASIPTSPFLLKSSAPRALRFCFAKKDETLEKAAERLRSV
ncbi:MAG: methionine aminotransferase [Vicinamibacterales bacterium]